MNTPEQGATSLSEFDVAMIKSLGDRHAALFSERRRNIGKHLLARHDSSITSEFKGYLEAAFQRLGVDGDTHDVIVPAPLPLLRLSLHPYGINNYETAHINRLRFWQPTKINTDSIVLSGVYGTPQLGRKQDTIPSGAEPAEGSIQAARSEIREALGAAASAEHYHNMLRTELVLVPIQPAR